MRDGRLLVTRPAAEMTRAEIIRTMVGREVEYLRRPPAREPDPVPVLEVDDVTLMPMVRNMSFSAYAGEIVGLARPRRRGSQRGRA